MKKAAYRLLRRLLFAGLALTLALSYHAPVSAAAEAGKDVLPASEEIGISISESTSDGTVCIDGIEFSTKDNVSSCWSDGKGWKNLAGQYVAMVDYDGSEAEVSMDSGVLTLAVAGVNRIGTLKGGCSVNIVGTGIVLIDRLELEEENSLSLLPNLALYEEGSAAVFLKEEEKRYRLINGGVTGILDEIYTLKDVHLTIPSGSSLRLVCTPTVAEVWLPALETEYEIQVLGFAPYMNEEDFTPSHEYEKITTIGSPARLTLENSSSLTIEDGASVTLETITAPIGIGNRNFSSDLIIQGTLNVFGIVEGGCLDVNDGGTLEGYGTVQAAEVNLAPAGGLSTEALLDNCFLAVTGSRSVSPKINESIIYVKEGLVLIPDLIVSGASMISVPTMGAIEGAGHCDIGNITFPSGGNLDILANADYFLDRDNQIGFLSDCVMSISGKITGGTVSVLAGCLNYIGEQTDVLPAAPSGYASRVLADRVDMESTEFPLNMTRTEATKRVSESQIPVMKLTVTDTRISEEIGARMWDVSTTEDLDPLDREEDQYFTCASFLEAYNLREEDFHYIPAVEIIRESFSREIFFMKDPKAFSTEGVIMIRVIDCTSMGGQGGSAISHTETSFTGCGVLGDPGAGKVIYFKETTPPPDEKDDEPDNKDDEPDNKDDDPDNKDDEPDKKDDDPDNKDDDPDNKDDDPDKKDDEPDNKDNEPDNKDDNPDNKDDEPDNKDDDPDKKDDEPDNKDNEPDKKDDKPDNRDDEPDKKDDRSGRNDSRSGENNSRYNVPSAPEKYNDTTPGQKTKTDSGLTAVAEEEGNGRYILAVYRNGKKLDSLNGQGVTVRVKAPEGILDNDILYAVFENGSQSRWIPAEYDKKTKELVFETDQTGTFGIARVAVEDIIFTAADTDKPVYRKLSVLIGDKEITDLPVLVNASARMADGEINGTGLYAVFVNKNEELSVFPVIWDKNNNKYLFEADVTGNFVVVRPDNAVRTAGELNDACRESEEVRILITLMRLQAFWS